MITFIICCIFTFISIYSIDIIITDFEPFRTISVYLVGLITALIFYYQEIYVQPVTFLKETRILQQKIDSLIIINNNLNKKTKSKK